MQTWDAGLDCLIICHLAQISRFLGCVFMRRQLQHIIKSEEYLTSLTLPEPSVIGFKVRLRIEMIPCIKLSYLLSS